LSGSIVDVLENALDGNLSAERVGALAMLDIRRLRDVVIEFYDAWAPYPPGEDILRAHLGGWIAATGGEGTARDLLHAALFYAHEIVIHDPVAAYFEPRRQRLRVFPPVQGIDMNADALAVNQERRAGYEHGATISRLIGRILA
jgi:hypothetical protein